MSKSLFEQYLEKINKTIINEEEKNEENVEQDVEEDVEENIENNQQQNDNSKEEIIFSWLRDLNAKFKPLASFKIIVEKNENGNEETFLGVKPKEEPMERYFYNLSNVEKFSKEVYKEIIKLADERIKSKIPISEDFKSAKIKAKKGWKKKIKTDAILEYRTEDNKKILEVISESRRGSFKGNRDILKYGIAFFDEESFTYQILEDNIKTPVEVGLKIKEYMDTV